MIQPTIEGTNYYSFGEGDDFETLDPTNVKPIYIASVASDGGSNPASGYSLIEADSLDAALEKTKGCPVLASRGSVEVAKAFDM